MLLFTYLNRFFYRQVRLLNLTRFNYNIAIISGAYLKIVFVIKYIFKYIFALKIP